jgi:hypothetical protein
MKKPPETLAEASGARQTHLVEVAKATLRVTLITHLASDG